jgi:hypothetical protein
MLRPTPYMWVSGKIRLLFTNFHGCKSCSRSVRISGYGPALKRGLLARFTYSVDNRHIRISSLLLRLNQAYSLQYPLKPLLTSISVMCGLKLIAADFTLLVKTAITALFWTCFTWYHVLYAPWPSVCLCDFVLPKPTHNTNGIVMPLCQLRPICMTLSRNQVSKESWHPQYMI